VGVRPWGDQNGNIHQVSPDLLDEVLLRGNADKNLNLCGRCRMPGQEQAEKQSRQTKDAFHDALLSIALSNFVAETKFILKAPKPIRDSRFSAGSNSFFGLVAASAPCVDTQKNSANHPEANATMLHHEHEVNLFRGRETVVQQKGFYGFRSVIPSRVSLTV
jgi:hypothetical protein